MGSICSRATKSSISIALVALGLAAVSSSLLTVTERPLAISKPLTTCSQGTSWPSTLQTRFWWMRPPSLSCTRWKRTSFGEVAENSFTGTDTRPKLTEPLQMGRAIALQDPVRQDRRQRQDLGRGPALVREHRRLDAEVLEEPELVLAEALQPDRLLRNLEQRAGEDGDAVVDEVADLREVEDELLQ